jgi:hypothetical protein
MRFRRYWQASAAFLYVPDPAGVVRKDDQAVSQDRDGNQFPGLEKSFRLITRDSRGADAQPRRGEAQAFPINIQANVRWFMQPTANGDERAALSGIGSCYDVRVICGHRRIPLPLA